MEQRNAGRALLRQEESVQPATLPLVLTRGARGEFEQNICPAAVFSLQKGTPRMWQNLERDNRGTFNKARLAGKWR